MADASTVGLVMTSSVIAAVVTQGTGWLKDLLTSKKSRKLGALLLATELEEYARGCSRVVSDSETYEASGGYAGQAHVKLEDLPNYSPDIDWKSLGIMYANSAFALRAQVKSANAKISSSFEHDDEEAIREVRMAGCDVGLRALEIASSLREANGIPALELNPDWNFRMHLKEMRVQFAEAEDRRLKRNKQVLAHLTSKIPPEEL